MPSPFLPPCSLCFTALLWLMPAAASEWRVDLGPEDALYPVLDLSQAGHRDARPGDRAFGDGSGLLQVEVRASRDGQRVRLRLEAAHLQQPASLDVRLAHTGERYLLRPKLDWDRQRLDDLHATTTEVLDLTLEVEGEALEQRRVEARLHPLDEALYFARDGGERVDLSWIFAAYADPRDATVDDLLARARAAHPELRFGGYEDADADAVLAQTYALWEAVQTHGVRYADEDPGLARGPRLWSQRVRRHGEVWEERRANCLDGSLLLAAAAERLGLHAVLLLVPKHALLAIHTRADGSAPAFIETTVLGESRLPLREEPAFTQQLDGRTDNAALGSFEAALAAGNTRYRRDARRFGQHDPNYQWIDLATARAYGILPLSTSAPAPVAASTQ